MASSGEATSCPVCLVSFKHVKHLRRHSSTHSSERPHKCNFCDACFKRRDILRKHFKICSTRLNRGEAIPGGPPPGKAPKSCDSCAAAKKACDQKTPCATCAAKQQICTYQRATQAADGEKQVIAADFAVTVNNDLDFMDDFIDESTLNNQFNMSGSTEWWNWDDTFQNQQPQVHQPWQLQTNGQRFNFLLHFTRTSGLKKSFNYRRERSSSHGTTYQQQETRITTGLDPTSPTATWTTSGASQTSEEWNLFETDFGEGLGQGIRESAEFGIERMVEWLDDPLFSRTKEIWSQLREASSVELQLQTAGPPKSKERDAKCLQFFCPSNLRKFLGLYWDEWSPNCPILHKPTFDIQQVPTLLLTSMVLMGAFMSTLDEDNDKAREWLDITEDMIFSNALLSIDTAERLEADVGIPPQQILQAAYILCLLQNWEGSDTVKRRIRQQRYASVIAAARDMGLSSANHHYTGSETFSSFDWYEFIRREETIRTFSYVFLLDNAFMIFNNAPPRMFLHEMDVDLTCSEESFQATNAEECWRLWRNSTFGGFESPRRFTFTEAIEVLAQQDFDFETGARFSQMSILNLFTIISGFHTVLFQQRTLFLCLPTSLLPVKLALERWTSAWESKQINDSPQQWQKTGFIVHADEYASLAYARLHNLELKFPPIQNLVHGQVAKHVPERLDDTSMSQVTDLMLSLSVIKE